MCRKPIQVQTKALHTLKVLNAHLILARLGLILHPSGSLIRTLLIHLQESHLDARGGVHGDLEVHAHRRADPGLLLRVWEQIHVSAK